MEPGISTSEVFLSEVRCVFRQQSWLMSSISICVVQFPKAGGVFPQPATNSATKLSSTLSKTLPASPPEAYTYLSQSSQH